LTEINIEDFDPRHIEHLHLEERCYSTFASGDLFFHIYHEIQEVYGVDVIPVCLQISFDGTDISGGGGSKSKSATPCNVRIFNFSDNIFHLQKIQFLLDFFLK